MPTLNFDPLAAKKQAALQQMAEYFNMLSANSLHADLAMMLAMLKGIPIIHPIEARDARLRETATAIQAATSFDAIEQALIDMRAPPAAGTLAPTTVLVGESTPIPILPSVLTS